MKKQFILIAGGVLLTLAACENEPHFTIKGTISEAEDKMLYLEEAGVSAITAIDSVELGSSGKFSLQGKAPQYPEFYRLRIDDKIINVVVDSTETVEVSAAYKDMPVNYQITGKEDNQKIKELTVKQITLQSNIDNVYRNSSLAPYQKQDSVANMMERYRDDIKRNYIFKAPNTLYAYFALFQRINNYMILDPVTNADDIKCFAAVATSFDNLYPHSVRATNLHNIAIKGMKNTRPSQKKTISVPMDKISEAGIIDIALNDQNGKKRKLTDLKGKVVLLDFTVYQNAESPARNMALREIYDRYKNQGLEIYQVSLDGNEHYWKTAADNLPWICVRDPRGGYSSYVSLYNVANLPTYFLINRSNELKLRQEAIKDLETEIKKLL